MTMPEMTETNPMEAVFNNYFAIKDALVKTNATIANGKSAEWLTILKLENRSVDGGRANRCNQGNAIFNGSRKKHCSNQGYWQATGNI